MTVLVLAPHADDEVLGMGGTIARFAEEGKSVVVAVLTGYGEEPHPFLGKDVWSVVRKESSKAVEKLGVDKLLFENLPAACLDNYPNWKINKVVADLIDNIRPSELYIPYTFDLHQDHVKIAYAASVATRPYLPVTKSIKRILAYETLSETHLIPAFMSPGFQPNVFVDISDYLDRKLDAMSAYESQLQEGFMPRTNEALTALASFRGSHINVKAAEGFVLVAEYIR